MIKYWLKLWSINTNLFEESIKSIQNWYFDFIELYIVPEDFKQEQFEIFKDNNIKISFHLPHSAHLFNPIDSNNNSEEIWEIIKPYIDFLDPFKIVLHPEIWNDVNILKKRLKYFNNDNIIIENMPKKSSIDKNITFYWYNLDQIKKIKEFSPNFCFDFAKAKSSALSQWLNIIDFSNNLINLINPNYFHISGFLKNTEVDEHFDLWEWDKELIKFMKTKLVNISKNKNINIVFECRKKDWINNDLKNLEYFKSI